MLKNQKLNNNIVQICTEEGTISSQKQSCSLVPPAVFIVTVVAPNHEASYSLLHSRSWKDITGTVGSVKAMKAGRQLSVNSP